MLRHSVIVRRRSSFERILGGRGSRGEGGVVRPRSHWRDPGAKVGTAWVRSVCMAMSRCAQPL
jgi:hypothetical protein